MEYLAQVSQLPNPPNFNPKFTSLGGVIAELTKYLFVIAGLALLLYLIYGGFQMMTSGGDPAKLKQARAVLTNGVVGFLIIFLAYWLVQLTAIIFGIKEIQNIFPFSGKG